MFLWQEVSQYPFRIPDGDLDVGLLADAGTVEDGFPFKEYTADGVEGI